MGERQGKDEASQDREPQDIKNLEQLLDQIGRAGHGGRQVTMEDIIGMIGRRSFGPLLLLAGVIIMMPLVGDIPGVPTLMAMLVILVAGQLLLRRDHFWLPQWLLKRSVDHDKLDKALHWMRPPARFIDRPLRPRLTFFTHDIGTYVTAGICAVIALAMPLMEFVPFSANGAGVALTVFGLALIANDGLMALLAILSTVMTFGFVIYMLI
ncbi:exopolysaccharide biosynthesis protein [Halomonas shantousis]